MQVQPATENRGRVGGSGCLFLVSLLIIPCLFAESSARALSSACWTSEAHRLVRAFRLSAHARDDLAYLSREPHPAGSSRQKELAIWLLRSLRKQMDGASLQSFPLSFLKTQGHSRSEVLSAEGINVLAWLERKNSSCTMLLGSHYDSKFLPGIRYRGAHDGGSSSVALMEMAAYLAKHRQNPSIPCHIVFIWFDGEESRLPGWNDWRQYPELSSPDHTQGSRYFVRQLKNCRGRQKEHCPDLQEFPMFIRESALSAMILMDMTGHPDIKITEDLNSDPTLRALLKQAMRSESIHISAGTRQHIEDDHIPFIRAGIPAINLIDFEHFGYWHQPSDLPETVSSDALLRASRLALSILLAKPSCRHAS